MMPLKCYQTSESTVNQIEKYLRNVLLLVLLSLIPIHLHAEDNAFGALSIEQLLDVDVYSVAKKASSVADTAASVYVLRNYELKRLGATSVAEALRAVPGIHVAQVNSHSWAISMRGGELSLCKQVVSSN